MIKIWAEEREGEDRLKSGICVPALQDAHLKGYPYAIMTDDSVSVLGELLAVAVSKDAALKLVNCHKVASNQAVPEWHGCKTGDCPHEKQVECDKALAEYSSDEPTSCKPHEWQDFGNSQECRRCRTTRALPTSKGATNG